jgi:hypothetical protein
MGIPTLLVFDHGKLLDRIIGALPKQMLELKIKCHLWLLCEERRRTGN